MRRLLYIMVSVLALWPETVVAQVSVSMTELKRMVQGGLANVQEDLYVEGVYVSKALCGNLETNVNDTYKSVSDTENRRTGYIQSVDGAMGMGLHFQSSKYADIPQFALVRINLKGAELKLLQGVGLSAYNLGEGNAATVVAESYPGFRPKEKFICELTDDDIFTYVRLKGCECVFKDGAYGNIYEKYALKSSVNAACKPYNTMDVWSSVLCDQQGNSINMLVNSSALWRRSGNGVIQGVFDLEGIIVKTDLPRYGNGNLSKYQIRPMVAENFIVMSAGPEWNTLCLWDWNGGASDFQPSAGKGVMVCNVPGATFGRAPEANNPVIISHNDRTDKDGLLPNAALCIKAKAESWWNWEEDRGNGLYLTVNTQDLNADKAYLAFSFCGGKLLEAERSYDFPSFWKVEYTFDGTTWMELEDKTAAMHSMIWKANRPINGLTYPVSGEVGLGYTEHVFAFPENISGKNAVTVRIVPASKTLSTLSYRNSAMRANRQGYTNECLVNFGSIMIRYR